MKLSSLVEDINFPDEPLSDEDEFEDENPDEFANHLTIFGIVPRAIRGITRLILTVPIGPEEDVTDKVMEWDIVNNVDENGHINLTDGTHLIYSNGIGAWVRR